MNLFFWLTKFLGNVGFYIFWKAPQPSWLPFLGAKIHNMLTM